MENYKILDATPAVIAVSNINLANGSFIPHQWSNHILTKKGAFDLLTAYILADIVYWHRLMPVYDNGVIIGYSKKFRGDKLQKQTKDLAKFSGYTEKAVNSSLNKLVEMGLISREFRDVTIDNGIVLQKRQFIEIIADALKMITDVKEPQNGYEQKVNRSKQKVKTLYTKGLEGVNKNNPYTIDNNTIEYKQEKEALPSKFTDNELMDILKECTSYYLKTFGGAISNPNTHLNQFKEHSDYATVIPTLLEILKNQNKQLDKAYPDGKRPYAQKFSTYIFERSWETVFAVLDTPTLTQTKPQQPQGRDDRDVAMITMKEIQEAIQDGTATEKDYKELEYLKSKYNYETV